MSRDTVGPAALRLGIEFGRRRGQGSHPNRSQRSSKEIKKKLSFVFIRVTWCVAISSIMIAIRGNLRFFFSKYQRPITWVTDEAQVTHFHAFPSPEK